jgi:hypothetical protein
VQSDHPPTQRTRLSSKMWVLVLLVSNLWSASQKVWLNTWRRKFVQFLLNTSWLTAYYHFNRLW